MNTKDFDAFWAEQKKEPIAVITVMGDKVELPDSIPAAVPLATIRANKSGLDEFKTEQLYEMSFALFGKGNVQGWLDNGLTINQLQDLIEYASEQYVGDSKNKETPKKGE